MGYLVLDHPTCREVIVWQQMALMASGMFAILSNTTIRRTVKSCAFFRTVIFNVELPLRGVESAAAKCGSGSSALTPQTFGVD